MASAPSAAWTRVAHRSPLCEDLFGAAVFEEDRVLGVAWDVDRSAAQQRAIGEAYERSALFASETGEQRVGTAETLGDAAIELSSGARLPDRVLADRRFSSFRWTPQSAITWTTATRGHDGQAVYVPLDLMRFRGDSADSTRVRPMSSVGTATASSFDEALERALVEVIERHVVSTAVRDGTAAVPCDTSAAVASITVGLQRTGLRIDIGLLPNRFGVPVAVAAVSRNGDRVDRLVPAASFGTGAGTGLEHAVRSAVLEAVQVLHLGLQLLRRTGPSRSIITGHERARAWAAGTTEAHVRSFFTPQRGRPFVPGGAGPREALADAGVTWWYRDLTPEWADGWNVVRVGAPALGQLLPDERAPIVLPPNEQGRVTLLDDAWERAQTHPFV